MFQMSITTRTGDGGKTSLLGGKRISKSSERIQSYGDVDELNSIIGVVLVEKISSSLRTQLSEIQRMLFVLGADLAAPISQETIRISKENVVVLEDWMQKLEADLPPLKQFILPRGAKPACLLQQARAVCRRAERFAVSLSEKEDVNPQALIYINRLSDYLFLVARMANGDAGVQEVEWIPI